MKKTYQKSFNKIKEYIDNDVLKSEPQAMYYINSAILSLLKTAKTISEKENLPIEKVNAVDIMNNYYELSQSISNSVSTAFDNYINYTMNSDDLTNRDKENLKKTTTTNLASFLSTLKDFLDSCGALEHSRIQHNAKMRNMNLSKLQVTTEQIDKEFDFTYNSHLSLPVLSTKAAFWANKAAKYIEHIKVGILLFEENNLSYTKENYEKFSDKDKITAIFKEEMLTKLKNDISIKLPDNYSFASLLALYSAILTYQRTQDISEVEDIISTLPQLEEESAHKLIEQIFEFHKEYDNVFATSNKPQAFSTDMYCIASNFSLEDNLYTYKSTLMYLLGYQLIENSMLPVPNIKHFGNTYDKNQSNHVLTVDLPNYFMPASFHYDKSMAAMPEFERFISRMPEYKGFFNSSSSRESLATSILFAPTPEQKKYIKQELRKSQSHPDSYRTKVLSHMNGMANNHWQEFDDLMNKQQQH